MYPIKTFTEKELKNILLYKYQSRDSPFLYQLFIQSFFDKVHVYIPDWITPNQLTFFGLFCIVSSLLITVYNDPKLKNKSRHLPLINFILVYLYFSADFVDGMHARRTKQCSPMGALLDHGVDSLACGCVLIALLSSLSSGMNRFAIFLFYNLFVGFYQCGLHIKYAGYLKFNLISGPSEGLVTVMLIHLLAWIAPAFIEYVREDVFVKRFRKNGNAYMITLSSIFTIGCIYELFNSMSMENRMEYSIDAIVSLLKLLPMLSSIIYIYLTDLFQDLNSVYRLIFVLSQNFTVCYLEETLSGITKSSTDNRVFLFAYLVLFSFLYTFASKKRIYSTKYYSVISTVHFIIRVCSIFYSMSKSLGFNIFFRANNKV